MGRISFQKRQKEMKRQEKQRMKAEKRAQRKISKGTEPESELQLLSGPPTEEVPADEIPQDA
jgi:hypothetical protein